MLPRQVQAVVFDMDGLLVDTEAVIRDAMGEAARAVELHLPAEVFHRMIGLNHAESQRILVDHFGPGFAVERFIGDVRERMAATLDAGVALKAGVIELLDHLDAAGLPRAIATSSPHHEVSRNLGPRGLTQRFNAVIARGDYARGKPHPDPFLAAAKALSVPPEACLALEDSHNGVRAAHAAGMMTVMVPDLLEATPEMHGLCVRIAESLHDICGLIPIGPDAGEEQA